MKKTALLLVHWVAVFLFFTTSFVLAEIDREKTSSSSPGERTSGTVLTIGRVSDDPRKHYPREKALVDYAVSKMGDLGITKGAVFLAQNDFQLIQALKNGTVDWVADTPFSALLFEEKAEAEIILLAWKRGVSEYSSVIFAKNGIGIKSLDDLKGKKIAFEDPGSSTGFLLPFAILKQRGLKLIKLASPRDAVPVGQVGYVFAGGELNISTLVHKELAEAGAFSDLDWEDTQNNPNNYKENLIVLHQSKPIPRSLELVKKNLDPRIKERIISELLKMHETEEGKTALVKYKVSRFGRMSAETQAHLEEIRQLMKYVNSGDMK